MHDKRKKDRRQKNIKVKTDRRKGPRRLTCDCGGKIEVIITDESHKFICLRCGKKF